MIMDTQIHSSLRTVEWKDNSVVMIDQTKLPNELVYVKYTDYNDVADAIRNLVVRGAPAIEYLVPLVLHLLYCKARQQKKMISLKI